jgi:hypothetical protein
MKQWLSWRWLLLAMLVFVTAAIGIVYFARRKTAIQVTTVPGPPGIYAAPAWLDDGLVVGYEASDCRHVFCFRLYYLKPDGSERRVLSLPDQAGCDRNGFEVPTRLPDGRLGYILRCGPTGEFRDVLYMMTYNLKTEQTTPLLSYPLPSPVLGTGGYSWNPEMTRGITSDGNGYTLYEQLYWIELDRWEPLDVGFPQAYGASWSPDGQQIAFFGAPEQGLEGIDRLDAVYHLYLMKPDGTDIRPLVRGFRYPDRPVWSPDNRWLVFSARFGNIIQRKGLWLIEVATGTRRLIVEGDYVFAAWSPDGQRLVVVDSGDYEEKSHTRLVLIEMAPLLKP